MISIGGRQWHDNWRFSVPILLSLLIYGMSLSFDFTLDDAIVIHQNQFTKQGLKGVPDILLNDTFTGFFGEAGKSNLVSGGRYRPLTLIIFTQLWQLFGSSPWVFHLLNVLVYGFVGIIVLRFSEDVLKIGFPWSVVLAALFIAHPIHSEVVANVKGMDELFAFGFGMWAVMKAYQEKWLLAFFLFLLAMLSKEMAVTWIPVCFVLIYTLNNEGLKSNFLKLMPLVGAFVIYMIIRILVLGWPHSETIMEMMNNPFIKLEGQRYVPFTAGEKWASIFQSLWMYVQLLFVPYPLTHDYYPRQLGVANWSAIMPWLGVVLHTIFLILAFLFRKSRPLISFGLMFYLLSLILISNMIFPIGTHMGERFLFMASFGFVLILVSVLKDVFRISPKYAWIIIVLWSVITLMRLPTWKNDYTLFTTDVKTSSSSAKALNAAGGAMVDRCLQLQPERCDDAELDLAIGYLDKAISIHPNYKNAHLIKGNAHFLKRQYVKAIFSFERALMIDPNFNQVSKNLVLAYNAEAQRLGEKENDVDKAIFYLKKALDIDPRNTESLRLLGVAFGIKGELNEAISYFGRILEINPDHKEALHNLGVTYLRLGDEEKAKTYLKKSEILENVTE